MQTAGIIAEFNPFHNGHALLIQTLHRQNCPAILCTMSGPFTQRGEASVCSKWARAQMAVLEGVDLVIELPFFYAVRSAYEFARGGIHLLYSLGTTHLAFGSEYTDENSLSQIAGILSEEPAPYVESLHKYLQTGMGFAAARTAALQEFFSPPEKAGHLTTLLHAPNTILALEYLHVLKDTHFPMAPFIAARTGAGYHDETMQSLASAQAVRRFLYQNTSGNNKEILHQALPESSFHLLQQEIHRGRCPIQMPAFDFMVLSQIRKSSPAELSKIFEMREGLENRIFKQAFHCGTLEDLVQAVSGRRYPHSRIRRLLLYILMGLTQKQADFLQSEIFPRYVHVLAASKQGLQYIKQLKSQPDCPVFLSGGREIRRFLQQTDPGLAVSQAMLRLDLQASNLYALGFPQPGQRMGDTDFHEGAFFLKH